MKFGSREDDAQAEKFVSGVQESKTSLDQDSTALLLWWRGSGGVRAAPKHNSLNEVSNKICRFDRISVFCHNFAKTLFPGPTHDICFLS